jgi:hypothetical protein
MTNHGKWMAIACVLLFGIRSNAAEVLVAVASNFTDPVAS